LVLYSMPVSRCTPNSGLFWMKKSGLPQPARRAVQAV